MISLDRFEMQLLQTCIPEVSFYLLDEINLVSVVRYFVS